MLYQDRHYNQKTFVKVICDGKVYDRVEDRVRDGNCGLHALNVAISGNKSPENIPSALRKTREEMVKLSASYLTLSVIARIENGSELRDNKDIKELVTNSFKNIFGSIEKFKSFIKYDLESKQDDPGTAEETKRCIQQQLEILKGVQNFENIFDPCQFLGNLGFDSNDVLNFYTNNNYRNPNLILDNVDNIKELIKHNVEQYSQVAKQDKQWITNSEIEGYMLSKGYVKKMDDAQQNAEANNNNDHVPATVLTFQKLDNPAEKLYIANNKNPSGGNESGGTHWFCVKPADNNFAAEKPLPNVFHNRWERYSHIGGSSTRNSIGSYGGSHHVTPLADEYSYEGYGSDDDDPFDMTLSLYDGESGAGLRKVFGTRYATSQRSSSFDPNHSQRVLVVIVSHQQSLI